MNGPNEVLEAIVTLRQATEAGFAAVEKQLAGHDAHFERLEMRFDRLEGHVRGLETRLTRFEAIVIQRFNSADVRFDDIDRRLPRVEQA